MSLRQRMNFVQEPLYLMDGSAFIYRGFYAFQNMTRSDGFPTNALYVVSRLLFKLLREERPQFFSFILDGKGGSFRKELYSSYKAQRSSMPENLVLQLAPIEQLLKLLGVPLIVAEGYEADDYIACLANRYKKEQAVVIIGADKDLKQCLDESVLLWDPSGKDERITTFASFMEETGMHPSSWPDYQALIGDSSDNIPGVPKIGPKTGLELIKNYPYLENLFASLSSLPTKMQERLDGMEETCKLYRELTRLNTQSCVQYSLDNLSLQAPDIPALQDFLQEYELRSLVRELASMTRVGFFSQKQNASPSLLAANGAAGELRQEQSHARSSVIAKKTETKKEDASLLSLLDLSSEPVFFDTVEEITSPTLLDSAISKSDSTELLVLEHKGALFLGIGQKQYKYLGVLDDLKNFFLQNTSLCIYCVNCKDFFTKYPLFLDVPIQNWFDISLAAYLISPEDRSYDIQHLYQRYGDISASNYTEQENPILLALDIGKYLLHILEGLGLHSVYKNVELPLIPLLYNMEKEGILLDKKAFSLFLEEVQKSLECVSEKVIKLAGKEFNIRSSQQLSDVLFHVLELPRSGKTPKGASSTSQEALEKLLGKHPIIEEILEYRKLEKLRSTYLEPLPRLVDGKGRLHTTFNQMATATGRLSSSNPNLQNIPVKGAFGERMRGCFVAQDGCFLISADYSQIELRVLAHLSQDPTLLEAFRLNEDIHTRTAGLLFDVDLAHVSADQRRIAKTINFGLIYGMGAQKLAGELHISMSEAKTFIQRYFERFSQLKKFYDFIEEEAKDQGFVSTMAGRRRLTPDLISSSPLLRSQARRQAINTRIQGSAADIIKLAMLAVQEDTLLKDYGARLLLQIHDELLFEVTENNVEKVKNRVNELMEGVAPNGEALSVPLLVDVGFGKNWGEAH